MTVKLDMVFRADATAVKPAADSVKREMDAVTAEVTDANAALEKHADALDRDADASRKAAEAAKQERAERERVNQATGARPRSTPTSVPSSTPSSVPSLPSGEGGGGPTQKMLDDLRRQYNPRYAALVGYRESVEDIRKANKLGAIGHDEMTAAIGRQRQATLSLVQAQKTQQRGQKPNNPLELQPWQRANLMYQANDTVQSLALGMPVMQVLLQQGPQAVQIYGGVGNAMKAALAAMTPVRLAIGGTTAVLVTGAMAWNDYLKSVKEVETAAAGLGRGTSGSASSMEASARAGADAAGISISSARSMEAQFLRTGKIGAENFEQLIGISKNFAATLGISADDAGAALAEMFADPAKAADVLYQKYGLIDGASSEYARRLAAQNDLSGAQRVLLDALPGRLANASEATTALGRAWQSVAAGASNAWDAIGRGVNAAFEGPSRDERIKELEAARNRFAPSKASFILGTLNGGSDKFERAQAELQTLQAQRRQQEEDAERVRALRQRSAASAIAVKLSEESPANAFAREREALDDRLKAMRSGPPVGDESAIQREMRARAIDAQTRALQTLIPEEEKSARIAELDIRLQSERSPLIKANLTAQRERLSLSGKILDSTKAEAQIATARDRSLQQASVAEQQAREGRNRALDGTGERLQFELSLIGKSRAEQETLRQEFELIQQVKDDAWARGKPADEDEIQRIKEKTAEYGRLREAIKLATAGINQRGPIIGSAAADERATYLEDNAKAQERMRKEEAIRRDALSARSPRQLADIARREAELAPVDPSETADTRAIRIATVEREALERAEKSLSEAQRERGRSLDQTLAGQRLELELIGKTTGETERLRMQFQLTAQLKEEAARNGTRIDQAELASIQRKAAEYGRLADQLAQVRLANDLQFERDQVFRNDRDQQIASQLRSAGQPIDFSSASASAIRMTEALKDQKKAWEDIRDAGRDAIDTFVDGFSDGKEGVKDALDNIGKDLLKDFSKLWISNPMKNALYGDNLPTLKSVGGIGGILSALTGGKMPGMDVGSQSVGAMSVNAATVVVNGGVTGGITGALGNIAGANNNRAAGLLGGFSNAGTTKTGVPLSEVVTGDGMTAKVASAYASRFQGLLDDLQSAGYKVKSVGEGGYSYRNVAGTNNLSRHAFGEALDINPRQNPWSHKFQSDLPANINDIAGRNGLTWGGTWKKPDTMHFQVDKSADTASLALGKLAGSTRTASSAVGSMGSGIDAASQGLGQLGNGFSQFSSNLAKALGGSTGGINVGGLFSSLAGAGWNMGLLGSSPQLLGAVANKSWGLWADGGYTGPGGVNDPAGIVHAGEVVWSQRDVARAGGVNVVEALRLGRRGYANGGVVNVPAMSPAMMTANSNAPSSGNSAPRSADIKVSLQGARGDREIEEAAYRGMSQALQEYDAALPDRVADINERPRWRA